VVGVGEPEHVSGVLDDDVLKTAAGADERYPFLAGEADGIQGSGEVSVRAAGRAKEGVEPSQRSGGALSETVGREPPGMDRNSERSGRVFERRFGRQVDLLLGSRSPMIPTRTTSVIPASFVSEKTTERQYGTSPDPGRSQVRP